MIQKIQFDGFLPNLADKKRERERDAVSHIIPLIK